MKLYDVCNTLRNCMVHITQGVFSQYPASLAMLASVFSKPQRRRNCGGNGGARPRNAENTGRKYLFIPQ